MKYKRILEKETQKILLEKYQKNNSEYIFINEYFFESGNESDFLVFNNDGLCVEIEIKSTRQNYKTDVLKNRSNIYIKTILRVKINL